MTRPVTRVDIEQFAAEFDVFAPFFNDNFAAVGDYMRDHCPVRHTGAQGGYWVVTGYEELHRIMKDPVTFSNSAGPTIMHSDETPMMYPSNLDPPEQLTIRKLINPALLRAKLEEGVHCADIAHELIDAFIDRGECDIYREFAFPFIVQTYMKRVVHADDDLVLRAQNSTRGMFSSADKELLNRAYAELKATLTELLARRRNQPRHDDVVDAILYGEADGRRLTEDEQLYTLFPVTTGGLETTASVISAGITVLSDYPEAQRQLAADPSLIPSAVEEILRLGAAASPARNVTRDVQIGDATMKAGDRVLLMFPAANRDKETFPEATEFIIGRQANRHLAFGGGPHRCVGSNLARLELLVALKALLGRMQNIRVDAENASWHTGQIRAPSRLPVTFERVTAP